MRQRWLMLAVSLWLGGTAACEERFQTGSKDDPAGGAQSDTMGASGSSIGDNSIGGSGGDGLDGADAGGAEPSSHANDSGARGAGGPAGPDSSACQSLAHCAAGENCVAARCVPALVSCAAQKNSYPSSPDGVYWIGSVGAFQRAYCDMALSTELCTESAGEHRGRTRDKAAIGYTMTSVLLLSEGVCKLWALRATDEGYPFDELVAVAGVAEGRTCVSLGFAADGVLGACEYGTERTNCGFSATPLYWYGNSCAGCALNDGSFDRWTLQGPAILGSALTSMSGTDFTTCKVQN